VNRSSVGPGKQVPKARNSDEAIGSLAVGSAHRRWAGRPGASADRQSVNDGFFSIDCLALTRLDESPRGGAKEKRIQTVLHEDDELICKVGGTLAAPMK
jgi:hypothetical protein